MRTNIILICLISGILLTASAQAQTKDWQPGDPVEAGPGTWHKATVLALRPSKMYYRLHYEDGFLSDTQWIASYNIRARDAQAKTNAAVAQGPRSGKYLMYSYVQGYGTYLGYFILNSGGSYAVFSTGNKNIGTGTYSFMQAAKTVRWNSGPFADKGWDGTQQFDVQRDGKTHIIRLMRNAIGTNSLDSN